MKSRFSQQILIFLFLLFITACKKETNLYQDDMDTAFQEVIANQPVENVTLNEITLPNGENAEDFLLRMDPDILSTVPHRNSNILMESGPQDKKNLFIARMAVLANNLVNRSYHQHNTEGTGKPEQNGLAYGLGVKRYDIRQVPTQGICKESIYGLDCSGMVYQLTKAAGLTGFPTGTAAIQNDTAVWNNAFRKSGDLNKLYTVDLGEIPTSKFLAGDIIYWWDEDLTHIDHTGVIMGGTNLVVYQSNGDGKNCSANLSVNRGPRCIQLSNNYWFNKRKYDIFRIVTDVSGDWQLHLRCVGQSYDAIDIPIHFDSKLNGSVITSSGNYTDYDGYVKDYSIDATYDKEKNIMTGYFQTGSRKDKFEFKLNYDDTGYLPTTRIVVVGCEAEIRLVNLER